MQLDTKNPPHKLIQKLRSKKGSEESGLCIVEGWKCFSEASAVHSAQAVILKDSHKERYESEFPDNKTPLYSYPENDLKKCFETNSPEGILGIFKRPEISNVFPTGQPSCLHLIINQWRDPGNVGTAIRSARGLGVASVSLWGSGPDFFSTKVIRGSMGSVFHLPLARVSENTPLPENCPLYVGKADGVCSENIKLDKSKDSYLVIGSESHGFIAQHQNEITSLSIPLRGNLESLSAPIAAALLMDRLIQGR